MIRLFEWEVEPETCTLRRIETGEESRLSPRGMEVLVYLTENPGKVVTAQELLEKFWSRSVVSDHAVHNSIAEIRAALGDSASKPRYIKTFPKRGYSLLVDISQVEDTKSGMRPGASLVARLKSTVAIAANYRMITACLVIGSVIGAALTLFNEDVTDAQGTANVRSLVVLPFENINIAEDNRDWVAQFSNHLPTVISKIPDIQLRKGFNSARAADFINQNPPIADYVLSGSLMQANEQVRLRLELLRAKDGVVIFSDRFDLGSEAVFTVQDNITAYVFDALSIYLDDQQRNAMHNWGTESVKAYNHFMKAEFHAMQLNDFDLNLAIENYSQAIEQDPDFLNAYLGLANSATRKAFYGHHEVTTRMTAMVNMALREVIRLKADSESMLATQFLALRVEGTNQKLIEQRLRELILAGDAPAFAYSHYAIYLTSARMYDEAQQFIRLAPDDESYVISPDASWNYPSRVETPANLVSLKKRQLLERPSHVSLLSSLVRSAAFEGDFALANQYLERQLQLDRDGPYTLLSQVIISALTGSSIEDGAKLEREKLGNPDYNFSYGVKRFMLGDIESGIALWRNLNPTQTRRLYYFIDNVEIFFPTSVYEDPRYLALLDELGVGKTWQRHLMESIMAMSDVTGVNLNAKSRAAYESNEFMQRNNLWDHDSIIYPDSKAPGTLELSAF